MSLRQLWQCSSCQQRAGRGSLRCAADKNPAACAACRKTGPARAHARITKPVRRTCTGRWAVSFAVRLAACCRSVERQRATPLDKSAQLDTRTAGGRENGGTCRRYPHPGSVSGQARCVGLLRSAGKRHSWCDARSYGLTWAEL